MLRYRKLIGSLYESWTIVIEKVNVCSTKSIGETKLKRNSGSELCKADKIVYGFSRGSSAVNGSIERAKITIIN